MKEPILIGLCPLLLVSSCGNSVYMMSQLPGLRVVSENANEKAFIRWMESDPADEVKARVKLGQYQFLGLARNAKKVRWIPSVSGPKKNHGRFDVTWHGMGGNKAQHLEIAEKYMSKFNRLMLLERNGVVLDVYGSGPRSRNYIEPRKES